MPLRSLVSAIACVGIVACGAFNAAPTTPNGDAGQDGGDPAVAPSDGGATDVSVEDSAPDGGNAPVKVGNLGPICPTATAGAFAPPTRTTLALPPATEHEYPFAIATDSVNVYWVAQHDPDGDPAPDAYNGSGTGRIRRVSKLATNAPPESTVLLDGQAHASALALDGDYIYWANEEAPNQMLIRRMRRDCAAPCTAEDVVTANVVQFSAIRRVAAGRLFFQSENGQTERLVTGTPQPVFTPLSSTGSSPSFALRDTDAFLASWGGTKVLRMTFDDSKFASTEFGTFKAIGSPNIGASFMATDCKDLYALRADGNLWKATAAETGSFTSWKTASLSDVYAMEADTGFVYIGRANSAGLSAYNMSSGAATKIAEGSYWRLAADASGLYAGEHTRNGPAAGTIYRFQ